MDDRLLKRIKFVLLLYISEGLGGGGGLNGTKSI